MKPVLFINRFIDVSINAPINALAIALAALLALTACNKPQQADTSDAVPVAATAPNAAASNDASSHDVQAGAADLTAETAEYKAWVQNEISQMVTGTEQFAAALKEGDLQEAKRLYPIVRMHFERSEPIAESFGDLDPRIDNREADLEAGETWTGFHPIEKILWIDGTTKGTEKYADQLVADVKELNAKIATVDVTGDLMVQGSVDLLNEISTGKITGEEEIFSKTDLWDFKANIEGAEKIFMILRPKLEAKDPALVATLDERFRAVNDLLNSHKVGDGYKTYDKLTAADTKALGEAVNKLGEPLAQMGVILV